jgi:hypothetical protein
VNQRSSQNSFVEAGVEAFTGECMFAINYCSPCELQVSRMKVEREASKGRLPRFVTLLACWSLVAGCAMRWQEIMFTLLRLY